MIPIGLILANPLARRIAAGGLVMLVLLWGARLYTNRVYERAHREGKIQGLKLTEEQMRQAGEAEQKKIEVERTRLDEKVRDVERQRAEVAGLRATLRRDLDRGVDEIKKGLGARHAEIAQIPASELDDSIRQLLAELR